MLIQADCKKEYHGRHKSVSQWYNMDDLSFSAFAMASLLKSITVAEKPWNGCTIERQEAITADASIMMVIVEYVQQPFLTTPPSHHFAVLSSITLVIISADESAILRNRYKKKYITGEMEENSSLFYGTD